MASLANATTLTEQARLTPADHPGSFGIAVALDGDTAVLGAPGYIFEGSGASWTEQAELVPSGAPSQFGVPVAVSGDTVAVGAEGAVYVFVRSGASWTEQASLSAAGVDDFGASVALSGDTLAVGATPQTQKVYVYVRSGGIWSLQAELVPSDLGGPMDNFGGSVAVEADTLVVGASTHFGVGSVYVFTRSATVWSERTQLLAETPQFFAFFGNQVAISGGTVVVGAPGEGPELVKGAAYVFVGSGDSWARQARLEASDGASSHYFGISVAISGDRVVIGAPYVDDRGAVYAFARSGSTWSELARLQASARAQSDVFGLAVAISDGTAMVGSLAGTVYVYTLDGVLVGPTRGLLTLETGSTATFGVLLGRQPSGDVVIDLASSDTGEGTVSPEQLTFTADDWATPKTVTLTGVDDMVADGGQPYTVVVSVNQALTPDPFYNGIDPPDVSAMNLEFHGDFFVTTPCRALDTRLPEQGPPLTRGVSRAVTFQGVCGVPSTARAVAVTVTVMAPASGGSLALFPSDLPRPEIDLISFMGQTRSYNAIALLAIDGTGTLTVDPTFTSPGDAHLAIDLAGYFE